MRDFRGRPLIAWAIEAAIKSAQFSSVIVSTDNEEIAAVAEECGATVPFKRPPELSGDHASTDSVILHVIRELYPSGNFPEFTCCIYPTAPLLTGDVIAKIKEELKSKPGAQSAFTAATYAHTVWRAIKKTSDGWARYEWPNFQDARSQDLPNVDHDAGQCYWVKTDHYVKSGKLINDKSLPVIQPRWLVQDIDTDEDWKMAEFLFDYSKYLKSKMNDKNSEYYLKVIDQIETVRSKNNVNWMDVLRLAFRHAPEEAKQIMKKINHEDHEISELLKKLEE